MITLDQLTAGSTPPPPGTGQHSSHANAWHITGDAVICEFGHTDTKGVAWEMLAFGLEYVQRHGKERLVLVLPKRAAEISALRAALLTPSLVDVWRPVRGGGLAKVELPAFGDAVATLGATKMSVRLRPDPMDTSALPVWALALGDWIESRAVERVRTDNYWSWHYRGRELLKIEPKGGKVTKRFKVTAGVKFSGANVEKYGSDTSTTILVDIESSPSEGQVVQLRRQVDAAIDRRRSKHDAGHSEHMLQGIIGGGSLHRRHADASSRARSGPPHRQRHRPDRLPRDR
jgi:hypothetical protein